MPFKAQLPSSQLHPLYDYGKSSSSDIYIEAYKHIFM